MTLGHVLVVPLLLYVVAVMGLLPLYTEWDGFPTLVAWLLVPAVATFLSVSAALLLGLPLRLIPALRRWWLRNGEVTVGGVAAGFGALVIGINMLFAGPEVNPAGQQVLLTGWCVLCFSSLHVVWPRRWGSAGRRG